MLVRHVDATQANATITPTPTVVVALRWGVQSLPNVTYQLASQGFDLTKLDSRHPDFAASVRCVSTITMSDLTSYGAAGYSATHYYSRSFSANVSKFLAATI